MTPRAANSAISPNELGPLRPASAKFDRWVPLFLFLATAALFSPAFQNQLLIWDDIDNLTVNENYRGLGWTQLSWMWTTFHWGPYQPLSWMTYGLDHLIWGLDANGLPVPFGFHLTNVLLHSLNVVLVYKLARRLLPLARGARLGSGAASRQIDLAGIGCAALAAVLFGWHPLRVESVAWATERRDVLSMAFLLGALLKYLSAVEKQSTGETRAYHWNLTCCWLLYLASLLSKSIGMTFPLVMLLLDWYPLGRIPAHVKEWIRSPNFRRACWEKIPFVAIALVSMALAIYGQRLNAAMGSVEGHTLPARIVQSFYGLMWYVWKSLWPSSLSPLYPLHVPLDVLSPQFVLNIFAVCGVAATLWRLRMRFPAPWIAWCAYAVMVSPMLGLVQSGPQITADRYSYLACLPWALLAAGWVWTLVRPVSRDAVSDTGIVDASPPKIPGRFPQLVWGIAAVATLLLARQTFAQLRIWHDDRTLWAEALRIEERNVTAHLNLGIALLDAEDTTGSLRHINRAVELQPGHPDTYVNRALVFSRMERYRDAAADLRNACRLKPSWVRPRLDLTVALTNMCDDAAAAAELQELSRLDPGHAQEYREGIEMLRKLRDQRRQALPVP